jgi:putative radical SAM enzyme (TIGR03279 family)
MIKITNIIPGSPADKAGMKPGDALVSINGREITDVLDYMYYGEDMGLEFGTYLMDEPRRCKNNCIFCFIDQLPPNMRETLYFKDDDSRLSFLQGNYISLTNLTEREVKRIIEMKLSVNVSVHTTACDLRDRMLGNPDAGKALEHLYRIANAGIETNCQIVLCPGINDGAALEKTLADLSRLPGVGSVACVPVGLTRYREGLTPLMPFDKDTANAALDIIDKYGNAYASDELFILAGRELPDYDYYGGFPQYENGVGMLRLLKHEFDGCGVPEASPPAQRKSIATGVLAAPFIKALVGESVQVYAIRNDFFGQGVTVAGLVTGRDLINQLLPYKKELGEELLIPATMLRAGEEVFLDDVTVSDAEAALGVTVRAVGIDGFELYEALK